MSEEPSQSFFSRIVNLFSSKEEIDKPSNSDQPSDEQIEELIQNLTSEKNRISEAATNRTEDLHEIFFTLEYVC